ncbi:MAG: hypothetical protein Fur006_65280 [Coleofasciculaceae cyanobacterium]
MVSHSQPEAQFLQILHRIVAKSNEVNANQELSSLIASFGLVKALNLEEF